MISAWQSLLSSSVVLFLFAIPGPVLAAVSLLLSFLPLPLIFHRAVQRVLTVGVGRTQAIITHVLRGWLEVLGLRRHEARIKLLEIPWRRSTVNLIILRIVGRELIIGHISSVELLVLQVKIGVGVLRRGVCGFLMRKDIWVREEHGSAKRRIPIMHVVLLCIRQLL